MHPSDLRRLNPSLGDLVENGYFELDGHLRVSSRDNLRVFEFDPATLKASPSTKPQRTGWLEPSTKPEAFLCAGGLISPTEWFGAHSSIELQRDFKPRTRLSKDYPIERSNPLRQLYRGRLQANVGRTEVVSMVLTGPDEYVGAAFVRGSLGSSPLRLSGPDGFLMTSMSQAGLHGTLVVTRVDLNGHVLWQRDTGIGEPEQILPDQRSVAFIGKRAAAPGKVPEPVLVIINNDSGTVATHLLWQRD